MNARGEERVILLRFDRQVFTFFLYHSGPSTIISTSETHNVGMSQCFTSLTRAADQHKTRDLWKEGEGKPLQQLQCSRHFWLKRKRDGTWSSDDIRRQNHVCDQ